MIVAATGELTVQNKDVLRTAVAKALAQSPRFVIVDLHGLVDHTRSVPAMCPALHVSGEREYAVTLVWCPPSDGWLSERMRSRYWRDCLRICTDRDEALAMFRDVPPLRQHKRMALEPEPAAASQARLFGR